MGSRLLMTSPHPIHCSTFKVCVRGCQRLCMCSSLCFLLLPRGSSAQKCHQKRGKKTKNPLKRPQRNQNLKMGVKRMGKDAPPTSRQQNRPKHVRKPHTRRRRKTRRKERYNEKQKVAVVELRTLAGVFRMLILL